MKKFWIMYVLEMMPFFLLGMALGELNVKWIILNGVLIISESIRGFFDKHM